MNQLPSPAALDAWALGTTPRSEGRLQGLEQLPPHHPRGLCSTHCSPGAGAWAALCGATWVHLWVRRPRPGQPETKWAVVGSAERRLGGGRGGPGSRAFPATSQRKGSGRSLLLQTLYFLSEERRHELKVVLPNLSPSGCSDHGSIVGTLG